MLNYSQITAEGQDNVLAPFLSSARSIAALEHPSIEAPQLKSEALNLIELLQKSPAIASSDLPEIARSQLELAQCSLDIAHDWMEVANCVKTRRAASARFKLAAEALRRTKRLLKNFISYQQARQDAQRWQAKEKRNAPVDG